MAADGLLFVIRCIRKGSMASARPIMVQIISLLLLCILPYSFMFVAPSSSKSWSRQQITASGVNSEYSTSATNCNRRMGLHMIIPMAGNSRAQQNKPQLPSVPINGMIKNIDRVRVIVPGNETDADGDPTEVMLGIFSFQDAMKTADEYGLDLVLINDKADPPVCKVIDYGKYRYIMEKKKKENLKKQVKMEIKEVKMSYKIDQHDFDVRMRAVQKFLSDGDRVKVVVQFKGREMQHKDLGKDLLMKIYTPLEEVASMESSPKMEGKAITMLLGSKKKE